MKLLALFFLGAQICAAKVSHGHEVASHGEHDHDKNHIVELTESLKEDMAREELALDGKSALTLERGDVEKGYYAKVLAQAQEFTKTSYHTIDSDDTVDAITPGNVLMLENSGFISRKDKQVTTRDELGDTKVFLRSKVNIAAFYPIDVSKVYTESPKYNSETTITWSHVTTRTADFWVSQYSIYSAPTLTAAVSGVMSFFSSSAASNPYGHTVMVYTAKVCGNPPRQLYPTGHEMPFSGQQKSMANNIDGSSTKCILRMGVTPAPTAGEAGKKGLVPVYLVMLPNGWHIYQKNFVTSELTQWVEEVAKNSVNTAMAIGLGFMLSGAAVPIGVFAGSIGGTVLSIANSVSGLTTRMVGHYLRYIGDGTISMDMEKEDPIASHLNHLSSDIKELEVMLNTE